jgi:hypothetical protein
MEWGWRMRLLEHVHKALSLDFAEESVMAVARAQGPVQYSIVVSVGGALSPCFGDHMVIVKLFASPF